MNTALDSFLTQYALRIRFLLELKEPQAIQPEQRHAAADEVAFRYAGLCDKNRRHAERAADEVVDHHRLAGRKAETDQSVRDVIFPWRGQRILAAPQP